MKKWPYVFIALGASLWGLIGIFVQSLSDLGFTPLQIVTLRVGSAFILLLVFILFKNPSLLLIDWRDSKYFVGTGILSIAFFNWCYFTAIKEVSLSVAVILLYTSPAFVIVLARIFFKEKIDLKKIVSLILTLVGCIFVIQVFPLNASSITLYGLLIGLGSGLGYALYSIFGKYAVGKYDSMTVTVYTFLFATLGMLPLSGAGEMIANMNGKGFMLTIGLGFIPTVLAYLLYTYGLKQIESGKASLTATVEPVVAALLGVLYFGETLTGFQTIGMFLVLSAIAIVQGGEKEQELLIDEGIRKGG